MSERSSGLASLSVSNCRRFITGQTISLVGSWTDYGRSTSTRCPGATPKGSMRST